MISKKLFVDGVNGDDVDVLIKPTEYLNALNVRFATTENGKVGEISNVEGNVLKNINVPAGSVTIGAIEDTPNKRIFWFNKNPDGIFCYDADTDQTYTVLLSSQVKGGLSFSEDIHSVAIIDNLLYWTDGVNPQRRINVEAGIKSNHTSYVTTTLPYVSLVLESFTPGTLYTNGTYNNTPLTGGSGSGAIANIVVFGGAVTSVVITNPGTGYKADDILSATLPVGTGFTIKNAGILPSVITLIRNQPWAPPTAVKKADNTYANNFIKNEAFQFAYRFVYRDGELSTFSPLSTLINFNTKSESTLDYIEVKIPTSQKIEQDVVKVELAIKFVVGGKYFIIKSFESGFSQHNADITSLGFNFYNDTIGIAVDNATAFKQFDPIPLKSETLEIARNRLFLGNNTDGYEMPKSTSLGFSTVTGGGSTVTAQWYYIKYNTPYGIIGDSNIVYIGNIGAQSGYYYNGTYSSTVPLPTTVDFNLLKDQYLGPSPDTIIQSNILPITSFIEFTFLNISASVTNAPAASSIIDDVAFKSDSIYRLGVVFYDEAGRKCGVTTRDDLKVVTPDRSYSTVSYITDIEWTLSNVSAQSEIPVWAKYYSVVMTKGLRASFFIQMKADAIKWVTKNDNDVNGAYTVVPSYDTKNYGLAVDVKSLYGVGLGYSFQQGDLIKLYPSVGNPVTLSVLDTYGSYIICDNYDISGDVLYEVFTPYIQSISEPFYEQGAMYKITNPGLAGRAYSTLAGSFKGDITILQRGTTSTYLVEAMSPSDLQWKIWNTNGGRTNIVLNTKLVQKKTNVCFSNVTVLGSETNGLSTFDVLDQVQLPYELSSIQKLQLVSKIEAEGTVMLAIGEQETASIYLGESQVFDNTGSSFLAKSSGVIGNVNVLRGSYGTINPESVVRYMGLVYWFDANRGAVVSYSQNGLFPISSNKMQKYFRKVGQDVLNNKLKFYGGVDPYHNEILMFAPARTVKPEGDRLLDMTLSSTTYPYTSGSITVQVLPGREYLVSRPITYNGETITSTFIAVAGVTSVSATTAGDITLTEIVRGYYEPYDAQGGVWAYQPGLDKWFTQYSFRPEWMTLVGNRLVTFKGGKPYIHTGAYNTFYGQVYDTVLAFPHNEAGNIIKSYQSFSIEGDTPDLVHNRTEVPYVQSSDIRLDEFRIKEGVNYATILRDRLSPNASGSYDQKVVTGDKMRGEVGKFQVVYTNPTTKKELKFANIGFIPSIGHTTTP